LENLLEIEKNKSISGIEYREYDAKRVLSQDISWSGNVETRCKRLINRIPKVVANHWIICF